jgi:DNA invertase Pin-like site-specific DNA recombinase
MPRGQNALGAPRLIEETEPGPRPVPEVGIVALGYVSATEAADGEEMHRQASAIGGFCARRGWDLITVIRDIGPPRRRCHERPAFANAIERLRTGEAAYLVVTELRRLCPSVAELGWVLDSLDESGGRLISLDPPIDTGTRSGRTALRALTSVSAWERARRAAMIAAARAKVADQRSIPPKLKRRIERMRGAGMTLQAIADTLDDEGVPTVRGGARWRPSSVRSALGSRPPGS